MRQLKTQMFCTGCALFLTLALTAAAPAASSLTNSLKGFTGGSFQAGTQATVGAAGFEFSSTAGLAEDLSSDPTVSFDASGANFGNLYAGDGGRNYMRTIDNYAFDSFRAEVTMTLDTLETDVAFFGIGSGNLALWGTPDFAGVPSLFVTPEPNGGQLNSNGMQGISGDWENPAPCTNDDWCKVDAPGLIATNAGTHRLQMTLDATAKTWFAAIDIDYAGGPFVADATTPTYDLTDWYDDGGFVTLGWPTLPSKIYFGGDDGAIFKDFSVVVGNAALLGDYNGDHTINAADYTVWRNSLGGATLTNDPTPGTVDSTDYDYWKAHFGESQGSGSLAGGGAVPEPTAIVLCAWALGGVLAVRRQR